MDRRLFLKESAVLATALSRPGQLFGATKRSGNGRKVVLVELAGGADGLNMVVPFTSNHYYAARPTLALPARETLRINDTIGLHPALASLRELYDEGKMAIVQGVGYPRPSRCHSTARLIWYSGNVNRRKPTEAGPSSRSDTPRLKALGSTVAARAMPERSWTMRLLGFARGSPADAYTDTGFAHQLKEVARAIRHDVPESVFHVRLEGFDTHKDQIERGDRLRGVHAKLLSVFASGVKAFWNEMRGL